MSDAEHKTLISEFIKLTGVDANHASSMLEAYQWNYDAAVSGYFDTLEDDREVNIGSLSHEKDEGKVPSGDTSQHLSKKTKSNEFRGCNSNIATLASLSAGEHDHSSSSNSDDEEGQAFYAGGSVHSGQQVLGPSKKSKGGSGIVKEMFQSAVSHGAEVINSSETRRVASQILAFKGVGHVLGSSADDSVAVSGVDEQSAGNDQPLEVCLKAWRNGFSIDDGPLRDYNDPENKAFLDDVRKGEVPQELTRRMLSSQGHRNNGGEIHLSLEDHSSEDFKPPKQSLQAFSGAGHRLGSPTPALASANSQGDDIDNENQAIKMLNTDDTERVTVVQVRLSDGSRLKIHLNVSHTVNDIRRYIVVARPQYSTSVFTLMNSSSYPMEEITDDSLTIQEANLLNSVLVQRMK